RRATLAAGADLADELGPGAPRPQSPEPTAVEDGVRGDLVYREDEGLQAGAEQAGLGGGRGHHPAHRSQVRAAELQGEQGRVVRRRDLAVLPPHHGRRLGAAGRRAGSRRARCPAVAHTWSPTWSLV